MANYDKYGFITELDKNEIFVFGSNGQGAHLGGAAATAVYKFGAKMGQAEGLQGQSYAINTMDSEDEMFAQIKRFIHFAENHPELKFYVTEIGCGIAGYSPEQIAPKFAYYYNQNNIILPESFIEANNKLMSDLFAGKKTVLFFEHAEPGAMGGNLGGVIFWYLDKGELKRWQSFRDDIFFELYNKHTDDFVYIYAGAGNYAYFNKETTFVEKKSDQEFVLRYKDKDHCIAGHCAGVTNTIMGALEPNTNFADFKQKETPPHYTTKEELETRRKKLAEMRKLFESKGLYKKARQ